MQITSASPSTSNISSLADAAIEQVAHSLEHAARLSRPSEACFADREAALLRLANEAVRRCLQADLRRVEEDHTHELIVVRTGNGRLPTRSDGTTINEEAVQHQEAGALEPGQPGALRHLRLHLKPGRYELLCNMAGHYFGGMHARLQVG